MFDFDVLGISTADDTQADGLLGLGTIHLGQHIGEVARGPALTLAPETSIGAAVDALKRSTRGAAVIVRQQRPVGVVTVQDLLAFADAETRDMAIVTIMTACREPLRATDTVGTAMRRMCAMRTWHLPIVCPRGQHVGSIDIADLTMWLRDRLTLLSVEAAFHASSLA